MMKLNIHKEVGESLKNLDGIATWIWTCADTKHEVDVARIVESLCCELKTYRANDKSAAGKEGE